MPTVAIFPRKVRLDSCEGGLVLESLFPVFAGSSGESSFNVASVRTRVLRNPFARIFMCAGGTAAQCRKNLRAEARSEKSPKSFGPHSRCGRLLTRTSRPDLHPFTGAVDHLTPDTARSPQAAGTGDSYQSNYRRSKT